MDRPDFWNRKLKDARPFGLIDRDFVPRNMARIRSQTRVSLSSLFPNSSLFHALVYDSLATFACLNLPIMLIIHFLMSPSSLLPHHSPV